MTRPEAFRHHEKRNKTEKGQTRVTKVITIWFKGCQRGRGRSE